MAALPLRLTVSCLSKIQVGCSFLVPAHLGSPWQRAIKRVCCCCERLWNAMAVMSRTLCFNHWRHVLPLLRSYTASQAVTMDVIAFSTCKTWIVIVTWTTTLTIRARQNSYPAYFVKCQCCHASRVRTRSFVLCCQTVALRSFSSFTWNGIYIYKQLEVKTVNWRWCSTSMICHCQLLVTMPISPHL